MSPSFGLSPHQLMMLKDTIEKIRTGNQDLRVYIFGSRARGKHRKYSDVDLLIEASPAWSEKQRADLMEALEESNLPFQFDIVTPEAVFDPYRKQIETEKILLFRLD